MLTYLRMYTNSWVKVNNLRVFIVYKYKYTAVPLEAMYSHIGIQARDLFSIPLYSYYLYKQFDGR